MKETVMGPSVQTSVAFGGQQDRREFLANAAVGVVSVGAASLLSRRSASAAGTMIFVRSGLTSRRRGWSTFASVSRRRDGRIAE